MCINDIELPNNEIRVSGLKSLSIIENSSLIHLIDAQTLSFVEDSIGLAFDRNIN